MKQILLLSAALLIATPACALAQSALPNSCAETSVAHTQVDAHHFSASGFAMTIPGSRASLDAAGVTLDDPGRVLDGGALQQLSDLASVALLASITGHHNFGCNGPWMKRTARNYATSVIAGARPDITWHDLTVHQGPVTVHAGAAHLQLSGQDGGELRLDIRFDHVTLNGTGGDVLAPDLLTARASLPPESLAALVQMAAAKDQPSRAVHTKLDSVDVTFGRTEMHGSGTAELTGYPDTMSADGDLSAIHMSGLTDRARDASLNKIAAALVIAKLVGHRDGDTTRWKLGWQGGVLTVNNVPLPLK